MIIHLLIASTLVAALPKVGNFVETRNDPPGALIAAQPWDCGGGAESAILVPVTAKDDKLEPTNGSKVVRFKQTVKTDDWTCFEVQASPDTRVLLFLHRAPSCEGGSEVRVLEASMIQALRRKCDPPLRFKKDPSNEEIEAAKSSVSAQPSSGLFLIRGTSVEAK
jgi:hypothetical protein